MTRLEVYETHENQEDHLECYRAEFGESWGHTDTEVEDGEQVSVSVDTDRRLFDPSMHGLFVGGRWKGPTPPKVHSKVFRRTLPTRSAKI